MNTTVISSTDTDISRQESENLLEEAKKNELLAKSEVAELEAELNKADDADAFRKKLFNVLQTTEEATEEYTQKMRDGVREGVLTEEDVEEGLKFFKESDTETKERVFLATADERLNFARQQLDKYFGILDQNRNLFSSEEIKNLKKAFLTMSSEERDQEVKTREDEITERKFTLKSHQELLDHELIDDKEERLERFKKLSEKDRKRETETLKKELKSREKYQKLVRKETDASKDLCKQGKWEKALPHCRRALIVINKLDYKDNVEWFSHRQTVITDLISKLEGKIRGEEPAEKSEKKDPEEINPQDNEITETENKDISEKRKKQLNEMLVKAFMRSKKASAATVGAFVHSSNPETIRNKQKDVDQKDNLAAKDHEEKEDGIARLEENVDRITREKVVAMAHQEGFNKKTIAIVNTDNRILSREEGDRSVNRNLEKVLLEEIKALPISPEEKAYLRSSISTLSLVNYGRRIRSDGAEGLNKHESQLGKDFEKNKSHFAHDLVGTIAKERKKVRKAA